MDKEIPANPNKSPRLRITRRGAGLVLATVLGAGVAGAYAIEGVNEKRLNGKEQQEIDKTDTAINGVVVLKAGVAYRSAPMTDTLEGSEPTFVDRVEDNEVLRLDRPVRRDIDGKTWLGFTAPNKGVPEDKAKPQSMFWVNITDLEGGKYFEVFEYENTDNKPSPTLLKLTVDENNNWRPLGPNDRGNEPVIATAGTYSAEDFYNIQIARDHLEPLVGIGEPAKIGPQSISAGNY